METVKLVLIVLSAYLISALPIAGLVWFFGRRRALWFKWEYPLILFPFLIWVTLIIINASSKSFSNATIEPFCCGILAGISPIFRAIFTHDDRKRRLSLTILGISIATVGTILIWKLVPFLPE